MADMCSASISTCSVNSQLAPNDLSAVSVIKQIPGSLGTWQAMFIYIAIYADNPASLIITLAHSRRLDSLSLVSNLI